MIDLKLIYIYCLSTTHKSTMTVQTIELDSTDAGNTSISPESNEPEKQSRNQYNDSPTEE